MTLFPDFPHPQTRGRRAALTARLPARPWLAALAPAGAALAVDLAMRHTELSLLRPGLYVNYGSAAVYEGLLLVTVFCLLRPWRHATALLAAGAGLWSLTQAAMYAHEAYFGTLPNVFSLTLLWTNTAEALGLMWASVTPWHFVALAALFALNFGAGWVALRYGVHFRRRTLAACAGLLLAAGFVLNHNFPFYPASYPGITYALYETRFFVQSLEGERVKWLRQGHVQRTYTVGPPPAHVAAATAKDAPQMNFLLLLGESERADDFSYYGYPRETAPYVGSLIREGKLLLFRRHLSVSNATMNNVPLMYSGVFPPGEHQVPFLYDYVKDWTGATTFLFSSQGMVRDQIRLVYGTSLDRFVYQENSGTEPYNSLGANDWEILPLVRDYLKTVRSPFFGVVQFNNPHYPYAPTKPYRKFGGESPSQRDRYDDAILEQDDLIHAYLDLLEAQGLLDKTLVVFTADHGEAFGEHHHSGHLQTLYNEEIAVPLWMRIPPGMDPAMREALKRNANRNTSHLDWLPTVLDWFGVWAPGHLTVPVNGASLLRDVDPDRPVPLVGFGFQPVRGVVSGDRKLVETTRARKSSYELYAWTKDRKERRNRWGRTPPQERARWRRLLEDQFPAELPPQAVWKK